MKFKFFSFFLFFLFFYKISIAFDPGSYLAGKYALSKKDYSSAINYYEQAFDINGLDKKQNLEIAESLCNLYLLKGDIGKCITIGKKIEKYLENDSNSILLALVINDVKKKNYNSALKRIKKIQKHSYERFSIPIINAWIIAADKKNYNKSINLINELEKDFNIDGLRYLHLALINEFFDKHNQAKNLYKKSINSFDQPSYRLIQLSGNALQRRGEFDEAKSLYLNFAKDSNDTILISQELQKLDLKERPRKIINNLNDAITETLTNLASTFRSDYTNNFSIIYLNLALYLNNDFEIAYMNLAELLEKENNLLLANKYYSKITNSSPFYWHARLRKARNLEILGKNNESMDLLQKMSKEKLNRYDSLKLLGDILKNYEKYKDSIETYNEAVSRIKEIKKHHWDLLYSRGMAYERSDQWEMAEKDFLKVLDLVPDQPEVLNYLGYSWIVKGLNLNEAKDLIIKAVKLRPMDPYIVDSLGWAYYKLGEYTKAVQELERAVSLKPTDPIINDHLGDAYNKSQRKLEAVYQWKKALYFNPDDELKKEIELKLKNITNVLPDIL